MKKTILYLGLALFAALAVLAIENPFSSRVSDVDESGYFIADYDSDDVASLEITQLLEGVSLRKVQSGWEASDLITEQKKNLIASEDREIDQPPPVAADSDKIKSSLGIFGGLEDGIEVSSNPENYNIYMVGPAGLEVKAFDDDGKIIFDIIIGKNGPDYGSSYARHAGEDKVYLVRRPLLGIFSPRVQDWLPQEEQPASNNPSTSN